MQVPMLDFAVSNFAIGGTAHADAYYEGPAPELMRIVNAVASQGSILNLTETAPCSNCRYSLKFYGPYIECNNVTTSLRSTIQTSVSNASWEAVYVAFVPATNDSELANFTFTSAVVGGISNVYSDHSSELLDQTSEDIAKTFIYYGPNTLQCGL